MIRMIAGAIDITHLISINSRNLFQAALSSLYLIADIQEPYEWNDHAHK